MNTKRVTQACNCRNIYFNGKKEWLNNIIGYGYEVLTPYGHLQADTLQGLYDMVMKIEKVREY